MLYVSRIDRFDIINAIDHPATTIWFAGCDFRCTGCQNPQLWDRHKAYRYTTDDLEHELRGCHIDMVLLGGEPLNQPIDELHWFISHMVKHGIRVWLYTGYEIDGIPEYIKELCYTIKTGRYVQELATPPTARLASSNQKFWRWDMEDGRRVLKEIKL